MNPRSRLPKRPKAQPAPPSPEAAPSAQVAPGPATGGAMPREIAQRTAACALPATPPSRAELAVLEACGDEYGAGLGSQLQVIGLTEAEVMFERRLEQARAVGAPLSPGWFHSVGRADGRAHRYGRPLQALSVEPVQVRLPEEL